MSFVRMEDLESREIYPGFRGRFLHTNSMTFSYWDVDAGLDLPEHSHAHEQVVNVLEGEFELTVGQDTKVMKPGDAAVIAPHTLHSGRAKTDCRIMDVFYPIREDYR